MRDGPSDGEAAFAEGGDASESGDNQEGDEVEGRNGTEEREEEEVVGEGATGRQGEQAKASPLLLVGAAEGDKKHDHRSEILSGPLVTHKNRWTVS